MIPRMRNTLSVLVSPKQIEKERSETMNDLLLIEHQRPQELPPAIQAWLDPMIPLPQDVQYIQGHVPMPFFVYCLGILPLLAMSLLMFGTMIMRLLTSSMSLGHLIVFLIAVPVVFGAAIWLTIIAKRAHQLRKAHQQKATRAGYLLSQDMFLSFDGQKVWLISKKIIVSVFITQDTKRKSSGIRFRRGNDVVLYPIHESYGSLLQIRRWLGTDHLSRV